MIEITKYNKQNVSIIQLSAYKSDIALLGHYTRHRIINIPLSVLKIVNIQLCVLFYMIPYSAS